MLKLTVFPKSYNVLKDVSVYHPVKVNPFLVGSAGLVAADPRATFWFATAEPPFVTKLTV